MTKSLKNIFPILFLLILTLIFFRPLLNGKIIAAGGLLNSDLLAFNFPLRYFYGEWLHKGVFPFWTPLILNGYPIFAESQLGMLYPIHYILFRFLSPVSAFNIDIIIHFALAGFFTYLFARIIPKMSEIGSLFSAIVFAFGGPVVIHILHTNGLNVIVWLPLELLLLELLVKKPSYAKFFGLVLVICMEVQAGYIEVFYYFQVFFGLYLLIKGLLNNGKNIIRFFSPLLLFGAAAIISVLICLPQISSTLELLPYSNRGGGGGLPTGIDIPLPSTTVEPIFNVKQYLASFVSPGSFSFISIYGKGDIQTHAVHEYSYLGILTLVFIGLGTYRAFRKKDYFLTVFISSVALFLLSLNTLLPFFNILNATVPLMNNFHTPRFFVLISFYLALLAGSGIAWLLAWLGKKTGWRITTLSFIGFFITLIVFTDLWYVNGQKLSFVDADSWLKPSQTALSVQPTSSQFRSILSSSWVPYTDDLAIHFSLREFMPPNFNMFYDIPVPGGNIGIHLVRKYALYSSDSRFRFKLGAQNELIPNDDFVRIISLEGVKYYVREQPVIHPAFRLLKEITLPAPVTAQYTVDRNSPPAEKQITKAYIYVNKKVQPRAYVVPQIKLIKGKKQEELLNQLFDPTLDLTKTVLLEEAPQNPVTSKSVKGTVSFLSYTPNNVMLETETDNPGYLVLTDTYYPGWKAFIDGQETPVYLANLDFRTIALPKGKHQVSFTFEPTYWRKSWYVSMTTMGLLIIIGLFKILVLRKKKVNYKLQIPNS